MRAIVCGTRAATGTCYPRGSGFTLPALAGAGNARKMRVGGPAVRASILPAFRGMLRSVLVLQAAALLGVSRRTVYYRIRAGRLRTIRTRCGSQRVLMESIEALLRAEGPVRVRGADVSDTDPCAKSPAPSPPHPLCRDARETPP